MCSVQTVPHKAHIYCLMFDEMSVTVLLSHVKNEHMANEAHLKVDSDCKFLLEGRENSDR